jgi:hypothetical protein
VFKFAGDRRLPSGLLETAPLLVGMLAISIPVALLVAAAVGGSVVVLVLAVLAMVVVGLATLTFVVVLAGDAPEGSEISVE